MRTARKVTLTTDLDALANEILPQPMWLVRPKHQRKYAAQRMVTTAEVVDLGHINLAKLHMFETR